MNQHVGIVVVHGVMPHPRYEIQDQTAQALAGALTKHRPPGAGESWAVDVLNPAPTSSKPPSPPPTYDPKTTISRVRLTNAMGEVPGTDVFDVLEAYWSPLDKNKTNWTSVLSWLLSTIFVPANTTARYMASWNKTCFDIGYVLAAAAIGIGALLLAFCIALDGFQQVVAIAGTGTGTKTEAPGLTTLWSIFVNPSAIGQFLTVQAIGLLACAAIGGFTFMQAVRAMISVAKQHAALSVIPVQFWSRVGFIAILLVLSTLLLAAAALCPLRPPPNGVAMGWVAISFTEAALLFEVGRALMESFVVNFFGDVQIYTTHDENSEYFALRNAMLDLVTKTIGEVTSVAAADGKKPYNRVHVLAHSLGSTIAMDALIRLYDLKEQGAYGEEDFARIRSFVTFGSPLEKTKYFFDIANPSQSLSFVQWRNDSYGVLFSDNRDALRYPNGAGEGIFWMNFWYFLDPVANQIDSYRSFLVPGDKLADASRIRASIETAAKGATHVAVGRQICLNERHPGIINPFVLRFIPHGDYLGDPWFWFGPANFGVVDIISSTDAPAPLPPHFPGIAAPKVPLLPIVPGHGITPIQAPHPARFEQMSQEDARWHRDRYGP